MWIRLSCLSRPNIIYMKKYFFISTLFLTFVLIGVGCAKKAPEVPAAPSKPVEEQKNYLPTTELTPEQNKRVGTWVHPKYLFSFQLPLDIGTKFMYGSPDTIEFNDPATQAWYGDMAIQSEIPEPPLTANKIEEVLVGGAKGKIFHDMDAQTGTEKVDKLMVLMPGTDKTVYLAVDGEKSGKMDLNIIVKTWKWNK